MVAWANAPTGATQYTANGYNGDGDRVWLQATNGATTPTTVFLGQLEEIATTGGTTTTTKYYYVGQRRLAVRVGSTLSYLVADGLASVTEALDTAGNVTASQLYSPYGGLRYQAGTMPTSFGFTGLRSDPSGFVLLPRRWVVERTFAWRSTNRRLVVNSDELLTSSEARVYLAMLRLIVACLARAAS
ncbi:MAG: transposase [Ktedonobacterales bacterium]|nr:transposase [Ktedonobacterales bacterium]